jgi:hypoxanthine phosphoribosyltransferase
MFPSPCFSTFAPRYMGNISLHNKQFAPYIPFEQIQKSVEKLAAEIESDYQGKEVVFVGVLNGAFRFVSELMNSIDLPCEVSFVKMASYEGTSTTGEVNQLIGFNEPLTNKHVIVLEDIVDTGNTVVKIMQEMNNMQAASVAIATLLFKPEAYKKDIPVKYVGIEIPNDFIVGFGLDFDGLGRNLNDIYKIVNT